MTRIRLTLWNGVDHLARLRAEYRETEFPHPSVQRIANHQSRAAAFAWMAGSTHADYVAVRLDN